MLISFNRQIIPLTFRAKGVSLSTATNWAFNTLVGEMTPYLQEKIEWRLYFMHSFFCICSFFLGKSFLFRLRMKEILTGLVPQCTSCILRPKVFRWRRWMPFSEKVRKRAGISRVCFIHLFVTASATSSIHLSTVIRHSTEQRGSLLPGPSSSSGGLYPPRTNSKAQSRSSSRTNLNGGWFGRLLNRGGNGGGGGGRGSDGNDEEYERLKLHEDDEDDVGVKGRSIDERSGFEIGDDDEDEEESLDVRSGSTSVSGSGDYEMLERDVGHNRRIS
jgi:hypothetical protein